MIFLFSDLLQAFQKLSYVERGKMVKLVWDFKGWMENSLINSHGLGDQFEFRIHTVDKGYLNQYTQEINSKLKSSPGYEVGWSHGQIL